MKYCWFINRFNSINIIIHTGLRVRFRPRAKLKKKAIFYSAFTFVLDQSRLWKFGELYGKTVAE
jgi:hypothetical protein